MFKNLYDSISMLLSWWWPIADGVVTAVDLRAVGEMRLAVRYQFSVANDGPYSGESYWPTWYRAGQITDIDQRLKLGQPVLVRYRKDDPSVNTLDRSVWQNLDYEL